MINNLKSIFVSAGYFVKLIFIPKKYDVVFVSSVFFNRGKAGKNILLKPMIECCNDNNLSFTIIEDTDLNGEYKDFIRNKKSIPFDFISLLQIIFRKIYNLIYKNPSSINEEYERDLKISNILGMLFFKKFYSKVYITLLWNNVTLWRSINPSSCIIDYQHGIIFDGHAGYVKDGKPPKVKFANKITTLVYGCKFKSLLINNDNTKFYSEKNIINVGLRKYLDTSVKVPKTSKKILFTLQITADFDEKQFNEQYVQIVKKLIEDNAQFLTLNNYEIIFRHHPRYSVSQCPELKIENDFVSFDNKTPILDLLNDVSVHITFNSTSSLDAAMKGIPTIFIDMHDPQSPNEIFFNQYKYPLKDLVIKDYEDLKKLLTGFQNKEKYDSYCKSVHDWSDELYQDFDESKFKNFLLETINFNDNA
tara:strand:- start:9445 stop:10701 length:1257 start_codon:yes stop_codon:yes gene_type:complete